MSLGICTSGVCRPASMLPTSESDGLKLRLLGVVVRSPKERLKSAALATVLGVGRDRKEDAPGWSRMNGRNAPAGRCFALNSIWELVIELCSRSEIPNSECSCTSLPSLYRIHIAMSPHHLHRNFNRLAIPQPCLAITGKDFKNTSLHPELCLHSGASVNHAGLLLPRTSSSTSLLSLG